MSMELLENLPNWALFIIFPVGSWLALGSLVLLFRTISKPLGFEDFDSNILDTATQNVMSGAYVVLGFVLVLVMATVNEIDSNITKEASQIEGLDRLLIIEGSQAAQTTRQTLHLYTKSIVSDEWSRLAGGPRNPITRQYADELFKNLRAIQPGSALQVALFTDIIRSGDEIAQYRNLRIMNSQSHLPNLFWQLSCLTFFGVIVIAALRLTNLSNIRIIALSVQLAMLSWLLATVMILDLPYLGVVKASPEAFERSIQLMQAR
ncbi:DUF4239 domain-containing protein [Polynucleobacter asymbioticus]|uniref:bestrophin-like domain n=1 Tax=Polynucleobacter asymbioticus TaxID=576611 RepID=UPI001BFD6AF5|nr:DUF4239 domain-containing protein [Polynucleobacter asymbioticus]QWD86069.1 DUF4239 domain-containing protein [Polynucleobacter asymbioticus]